MAITQSPTKLPESSDQHERSRQINSVAWAVFFIWVGVVMLAGLAWAWFLVGVGILILGAQIMRQQRNLEIETFGVIVGLIVLATGGWELFALPWPLMPIILIGLGGYLLWKALSTRVEFP